MKVVVPVIGVPRSGTSLVAEILHGLGVHMGQEFTQPPTKHWTPKHFWVDAEFSDLHKQLVSGADYPWQYNLETKNPHVWLAYGALVKEREKTYAKWGLKDEWLPFLWPKIAPLLQHQVRMVLTERPWEASVASYAQRTGLSLELASDRLLPSLKAVAQVLASNPQALIVDFDKLIDNSGLQIRRLAAFVGVPFVPEIVQLVDPMWKRF